MYNYKYFFKEIKKNGMQNVETLLNVKYRFAVNDLLKKEIKKRMDSHLEEYFYKKESLILTKNHYSTLLYFEDHGDFMRGMRIERPLLKFGLNISVISHLKTPLEKMLNLDTLDNFLLTGKIDF